MKLNYSIILLILVFISSCNSPKIEGKYELFLELQGNKHNSQHELNIIQNRLLEYGYLKNQFDININNGIIKLTITDVNNIEEIKYLVLKRGQVSSGNMLGGDKGIELLEKSYLAIMDSINLEQFINQEDELFERSPFENQPIKNQIFNKIITQEIKNEKYLKCFSVDTVLINKLVTYSNLINKSPKFFWLNYDQLTRIELVLIDEIGFDFNKYLEKVDWHYDQNGSQALSLKLNKIGSELFEKYTEERIGKRIALMIDNEVLSTPIIQSKISNGEISITGIDRLYDFKILFALIKGGTYPNSIYLIKESIKEKTSGNNLGSISKGSGGTELFPVLNKPYGGEVGKNLV